MSFTHVVDRAQLGGAYRGKAETEMIRIVHKVQKVLVKRTVGLVRKTYQIPISGWIVPKFGHPYALDI